MRVSRLALTDFRNYEQASVELGPGPTLIVGRNGQGKTNLVEALVYIATGSSHRVPTDQAMIRAGTDSAVVRTELTNGERTILVELQLNRTGANRAQANRQSVRIRDLPRYLQAILFSPEDLALVRGDPGGRRRFMDELLIARNPRMASVVADFERVLRQRNTLLKSARASRLPADQLTTLDVWDERLVALGHELRMARASLVEAMQPHVAAAYRTVAGDEHQATPVYETSVPETQVEYLEALHARRRDELDRGASLIGPHRDDLVLGLNDLLARHYASHGESWSYALALKLAAAELVRQESAGDPVVILDDVFAELDVRRRTRLAEAVVGYEQVLITAAVEEDVPAALAAHTIRIEAGRVVSETSTGVGDPAADDTAIDESEQERDHG